MYYEWKYCECFAYAVTVASTFSKYILLAGLVRGNDAAARVAKLNSEYKQLLPESILIEHTAKNPEEVADEVKQFYFGNEDISLATVPQIINVRNI